MQSAPLQVEGNRVTLEPGRSLRGEVTVPGDKSISHRALLFGAIAQGATTIHGMLAAEDPRSTADCLRAMGVPSTSWGTGISPLWWRVWDWMVCRSRETC